jgi:hypothetical protein
MSNYASVKFYPEIIHTADECGGVLNIERWGPTSEQNVRLQGHCKSCDAYLFCDFPIAELTANCPTPVKTEMALQVVPPSPKQPVTDEDKRFCKAINVKID